MVDDVLDAVVEPQILDSCEHNPRKLHDLFALKFDPIGDHTGFFFPGMALLYTFCY